MTEAEFQRQVVQLAELRGYRVAHAADSRRQAGGRLVGDRGFAGVPDLIIVGKRLLWAELKTETGKLSLSQRVWLDMLATAGQEAYVWRPGDLDEIQRVLQAGWRFCPRGDRTTTFGRALDKPLLRDESNTKKLGLWLPGSLWLPGRGRVDEQKERAA